MLDGYNDVNVGVGVGVGVTVGVGVGEGVGVEVGVGEGLGVLVGFPGGAVGLSALAISGSPKVIVTPAARAAPVPAIPARNRRLAISLASAMVAD